MPRNAKKKIAFVFPTSWDKRQLEACRSRWSDSFEIIFTEPSDQDCPYDFDVLKFIEQATENYRGRIDGVTSSSDYPGATVAGAIATRLGLAGSPPETVIRCSHKYYSRLAQREAAPEATPAFQLVDPRRPAETPPGIDFPFFIKPVKGAFSVLVRRIDTPAELADFLAHPATVEFMQEYMLLFNKLFHGVTTLEYDGSYFLAEGLLKGALATVEGFSVGGGVEIVGIVDSVLHPGTNSFARFVYPSSLSAVVQGRMADIASRVIRHLGLTQTLFNVEMIHDPATDEIHIIEINPRICGQFADLYAKVDGTNTYEIALALASGDTPRLRKGSGTYAVAASQPLRVFEAVIVTRAPEEPLIRSVESAYPETLVWTECETGQKLADFAWLEDGESFRYGIINLGAETLQELDVRFDQVQEQLGFRFSPCAADD